MICDYATGLIVATFFKNSPKSNNGRLSSSAGLIGIFRKVLILSIVAIAHMIDILTTNSNIIRDAIIISYIVNESISIIENAGLMGIPIPDKIKNAIAALQEDKK